MPQLNNYPEMWGAVNDPIQAEYVATSNKYRVTSITPLALKRGVTSNGVVSEFGANNCKNKRAGWFSYYFTRSAYDAFIKNNSVTLNINLD